ncbi:MAG: NAD(P)H-hydrate dehydratase [Vulcanimicrobiaceae bacterium]
MIAALSAEEMRGLDERACAAESATILMRRAGTALAAHCTRMLADGRVIGIAGPGNNGGDAFAACASLDARYERIILELEHGEESAARRDARKRAVKSGVVIRSISADALADALQAADLILDGMLGVGSRFPLSPELLACIDAINSAACPVLAIDIPSGIDADTGAIPKRAVHATCTLALGALKPGILLDPARAIVGDVYLYDLAIAPELVAATPHRFASLDAASFLASLPQRAILADKRAAGAVLLVAGSAQFPGAAVLSARAAMRAGAGYVTIATSRKAAAAIRAHVLEAVVIELDDDAPPQTIVDELLSVSRRNGALAIGPGLGLDDRTGEIVRALLAQTALPGVVDASALFHLSKHLHTLRGKPLVVTPHGDEFARLSGEGTVRPGTRVARVRAFVERTGITTLLKGRDTIVDDGTTWYVNPTGTNALATAGSGDVLTGIIAALIARQCTPASAASIGAYWHGLAGQMCSRKRHIGTMASDLPEALGEALEYAATRAQGTPGGTLIATA